MAYSPELLEQMAQAQDAFVWEAPAWEMYQRSSRWYVWMSLIALGLMTYALLTTNYLFAFIVLMVVVILVISGNQSPKSVLIQIGENGIVHDGRFYQFDALSDFAILYQPPEVKLLYVQPKNMVKGRLRISLEDQDPVAIRTHLKRYLDEDLDLQNEHASDIIARFLRV